MTVTLATQPPNRAIIMVWHGLSEGGKGSTISVASTEDVAFSALPADSTRLLPVRLPFEIRC